MTNLINQAIKKLSDNLSDKTKKLNLYQDFIRNIDEKLAIEILQAEAEKLAKIILDYSLNEFIKSKYLF